MTLLIPDLELIQLRTASLYEDYDSFITTFSMLSESTSFDDLHSKLLFYEQDLNCRKDHNLSVHQAFVVTFVDVHSQENT